MYKDIINEILYINVDENVFHGCKNLQFIANSEIPRATATGYEVERFFISTRKNAS